MGHFHILWTQNPNNNKYFQKYKPKNSISNQQHSTKTQQKPASIK
jgi:hypothetical protein